MKFYSEITKNCYNSIKECEEAEKALNERKAKAEAESKKLAETRKARYQEVTDAYAKISEVQKKYDKELSELQVSAKKLSDAFIKDYGSIHLSLTNVPISPIHDFFWNPFDSIFRDL